MLDERMNAWMNEERKEGREMRGKSGGQAGHDAGDRTLAKASKVSTYTLEPHRRLAYDDRFDND